MYRSFASWQLWGLAVMPLVQRRMRTCGDRAQTGAHYQIKVRDRPCASRCANNVFLFVYLLITIRLSKHGAMSCQIKTQTRAVLSGFHHFDLPRVVCLLQRTSVARYLAADGKPHLLATYGSHAAMDSDEEGMALPGDEQQPAQQLDATPSRSMAPDQQQQGLSPGPGLRSPSPFNLDANEAEADMADARSTQGLPVQEQQEGGPDDRSTYLPCQCALTAADAAAEAC